MNKKEQLEKGIRQAQEDVKKFPDNALIKMSLQDLEGMYRYWFEGGEVYDKVNTPSKDEVWVGCKTCSWERHEHEREDVNKVECHNCGSKETYVYPTTERKKRTGKSFIDGKDLGRTGNGENKCQGEQCTSNKPPVFTIPETNIPLCEECEEDFKNNDLDKDGKFKPADMTLRSCQDGCGKPIALKE
jgi:hypothetical protein